MTHQTRGRDVDRADERLRCGRQSGGPPTRLDRRRAFEQPACLDHVWDAFEVDDEVENPQPEYGDFWPELDDQEGA